MRGQTVRSRTVQAGLTAVLCLTLATAALRVVASESARDSEILLTGARSVRVTGADGVVRDVADGARLRKGDAVTTGSDGAATLVVDGRRVVLAATTSVVVPDGASLDLRDGSVLVDRRRGPGLRLSAGDVVVDEIARGGLRVDRSYNVRVSVYAGRARVGTTTGRRTEVPGLRTLGVAGRSLSASVPLALTGWSWEREIIPGVVDSDEVLNRLARGVDAGPPPPVVTASMPAGSRASDLLLPLAIGRAARDGERVAQARALRGEGGSWGVVAAILDARTGDVASRLSGLLSGAAGDGPAGTPGPGGTDGPLVAQPPGSSPGATPTRGGSSSSRPPRPTGPPPSNGPTPSQTPDPVEELVGDVSELLPTPTPTPSGGLLGGVLGG